MAINWTKIFQKHKGMWVALKDDEKIVVASGKSAKIAYAKSLKNGYESPILYFVPAKLLPIVG